MQVEKDNEQQQKPIETNSKGIKKGDILDGEITNITNFGAFVRLSNGQEGLVHISEIANKYVTDITKHVNVGDLVKVKVLSLSDEKKLELSIRKASTEEKEPALFIHKKTKNAEFEDKMTSFLKRSEEKQIDIRRNLKMKQGITKKRK